MTRKLQISPSWIFQDGDGNRVDPLLFKILRAIHQDGKLTEAAKVAGLSYRHCWNLLNKWSGFFGSELVILERGRGARLTPLGDKLMWAERRAAARFEPAMDNLARELNRAVQTVMEGTRPLLSVHASHGYGVALLPQFCDEIELDLQYMSAREALKSLANGTCHIAGFHFPELVTTPRLTDLYKEYLDTGRHSLIRFATRRMGLHVAEGNPKRINGIKDLLREDVRFINRDPASGSRLLFEQLLENGNVSPAQISGYQWEEYTHSAVAAHVAAGMADTGFGIETAARQFGLDFIPLAIEHYTWACDSEYLSLPALAIFLNILRSPRFIQALEALPGYSADLCGQIDTIDSLFTPPHTVSSRP